MSGQRMPGCLIAVVGPSGAGKDSIMAGMVQARPTLRLVRRAITRAPDLGGEDYTPMTPRAFETAVQDGAFCLHWRAHGLRYGIPACVLEHLRAGSDCLCNLSRAALPDAARAVPRLLVLNITAAPEVLAARLAARGREVPQDIASRLAQADKALPAGLDIVTVVNDGPLEAAVTAALRALQPVRA